MSVSSCFPSFLSSFSSLVSVLDSLLDVVVEVSVLSLVEEVLDFSSSYQKGKEH